MRHAWILRPGDLRVEDAVGNLLEASTSGRPYAGSMYSSGGDWAPMPGHWPSEIQPGFADDGLVETVPDDIDVDYDRPFYENYRWVAMLNPLELADRVHDRDDPDAVTVEGPAWNELDVEIVAVDQPFDDDLFVPPRRRWFRR